MARPARRPDYIGQGAPARPQPQASQGVSGWSSHTHRSSRQSLQANSAVIVRSGRDSRRRALVCISSSPVRRIKDPNREADWRDNPNQPQDEHQPPRVSIRLRLQSSAPPDLVVEEPPEDWTGRYARNVRAGRPVPMWILRLALQQDTATFSGAANWTGGPSVSAASLSSPSQVRVDRAAQIAELVSDDLRAIGGEDQPQVDHVLVSTEAAECRRA